MYLSRRVTWSRWASGTSAWRRRTCASLTTWRFTTAPTLELDECWAGERVTVYFSRSLCVDWRQRKNWITRNNTQKEHSETACHKPSPGSVGPACPLTWPRPAPTWPWCSWLMKESPTAASMQHTRPCQCWTVSSCFDLTSDVDIFKSQPVFCFVLSHLKGRVVPTSLPAVQVSVFSRSGCVTDGATAPTAPTNRAAATPPILHSVSLLYEADANSPNWVKWI